MDWLGSLCVVLSRANFCGCGIRKVYLLSGLDKELSVLDGRVLQDAVSQIQDMADASQGCGRVLSDALNSFRGRKQNRWINIPLKGNAWAKRVAQIAQVRAPIHAKHVCARVGCREK